MPKGVSWALIAIGSYAGIGLVIFAGKISFKNIWDKLVYGLLTFQMLSAVIVQVYILFKGNADVLHQFPHKYWYSFITVAYCLAMGMYVLNLNKRFYKASTGK